MFLRHLTSKLYDKIYSVDSLHLLLYFVFYLGLHNDKVWADGLLVFYEIFMYLEKAMTTNMNANLKRFKLLELDRTKAFEVDLSFYLGKDWMKNYSPRYIRL